jgi:hypothetical protein
MAAAGDALADVRARPGQNAFWHIAAVDGLAGRHRLTSSAQGADPARIFAAMLSGASSNNQPTNSAEALKNAPAHLPEQGLQFRFRAKLLMMLVQLGGLEPPTSCSTDRRSNQLSYNCILCGPEKGGAERGGN